MNLHEQRCENCNWFGKADYDHWCIKASTRIEPTEIDLINIIGCASFVPADKTLTKSLKRHKKALERLGKL